MIYAEVIKAMKEAWSPGRGDSIDEVDHMLYCCGIMLGYVEWHRRDVDPGR